MLPTNRCQLRRGVPCKNLFTFFDSNNGIQSQKVLLENITKMRFNFGIQPQPTNKTHTIWFVFLLNRAGLIKSRLLQNYSHCCFYFQLLYSLCCNLYSYDLLTNMWGTGRSCLNEISDFHLISRRLFVIFLWPYEFVLLKTVEMK